MNATITPGELHGLVRGGLRPLLIDVRTPAEYRAAHVDFARNQPLERFDSAAVQELLRSQDASSPVYVICQSGGRGRQACEKLLAAGRGNVVNVEGGTAAWIAAGLPVTRGKKVMALERQVRIAAGSLVLASAVLALAVSPYWIGLAAFVGAGLIFSGVTDTCGMGLLLARMPWNQASPEATATSGAGGRCCGS